VSTASNNLEVMCDGAMVRGDNHYR